MDLFDLRLWPNFIQAGGNPQFPAMIDQITIDSRRIHSKNGVFIALKGLSDDGHSFIPKAIQAGARFIIVKKGWIPKSPLSFPSFLYVEDPLKALQEIATAYRKQMPCQILAIAGSHGKTMVKDLLSHMVGYSHSMVASPESFNSQIGVALSLLTIRKEHTIALIEAGFSKKNEINSLCDMIDPDFSLITHIGKKHLPTLGSLKYAAEEFAKVLSLPRPKKWTLVPDDPLLAPHLDQTHIPFHFWNEPSTILPYASFTSNEAGSDIPYQIFFPNGESYTGKINSGFYYFLDLINITTKAAWLLGVSVQDICLSLENYSLEPMRTEIWKSTTDTLFINDSYCSDPQSIDKALKLMHQTEPNGRHFFLFGGMRNQHPKQSFDYKHSAQVIDKSNLDFLFLFGHHNFEPLLEEMKRLSSKTQIFQYESYNEALNNLKEIVEPKDTILIKGEKKYPINTIAEIFNESIYSNQCLINLAAISENIQTIRSQNLPSTRCMVMVKALAYGTNEVLMAKFLATCGIDILGVSYADEGISLKRAGASQSIFVINAAVYEAAKIVKWDLEIGVSEPLLIQAIANEAERQRKKIKVHLHIDTGMNRFGCKPEEALTLAHLIISFPSLEFEGIMTHFSCADDPTQDAFTENQAQCFNKTIKELELNGIFPKWRHAANSSASVRFKFPEYNMIRLGLAVYGLYSSPSVKKALELRLALSLTSRIVGINVCNEGESVSYGRSYRIKREKQKIAILPIGYFDGLHRNYSGKGSVIIRGKKADMIGKICMDFMMVDVTDISWVEPGDPVLIFGEDEYGNYLSPEDLAAQGDSIIHELITCLGPRIQRIFIHEEARRSY